MKKVLLSLLLAFVCMQVSNAAGDLPLSLDDVIVYGENTTFDPATGVLTVGDNYTPAIGWQFDTPIKSGDYYGIKVVFSARNTVNYLGIDAVYECDGCPNASIGIASGTANGLREVILPFEEDADITEIFFQSSNWENFPSGPPYKSVTIESATLLSLITTERVGPLSLDDMITTWWGTPDVDVAAKTLTLHNSWEPVGWDTERGVSGIQLANIDGFDVISNEDYVGCEYVFDPFEYERVDCVVETFEGGGIYQHVHVGSTSKKIFFPGEPMHLIAVQYSNHDGFVQDDPVFKNLEVYLLKKVSTSMKNVIADKGPVDVYTILGVKVRSKVEAENALTGLEKGIYIVGGKKVCVTK